MTENCISVDNEDQNTQLVEEMIPDYVKSRIAHEQRQK